jgi:hypothetical protein
MCCSKASCVKQFANQQSMDIGWQDHSVVVDSMSYVLAKKLRISIKIFKIALGIFDLCTIAQLIM